MACMLIQFLLQFQLLLSKMRAWFSLWKLLARQQRYCHHDQVGFERKLVTDGTLWGVEEPFLPFFFGFPFRSSTTPYFVLHISETLSGRLYTVIYTVEMKCLHTPVKNAGFFFFCSVKKQFYREIYTWTCYKALMEISTLGCYWKIYQEFILQEHFQFYVINQGQYHICLGVTIYDQCRVK